MDTTIAKAQHHLEHLSSDQETQALYRAREDSLRDLNNLINGAKREGMEDGQCEILHRLITKIFGPISPDLSQQIDQLTSQKLDDLAEQLLDFRPFPTLPNG